MLTARSGSDDGSVMVLIIGYTAIAAILIVVGVDVSKVFLAQRTLASATDSAALAAAQGVDARAVYDGPALSCGAPLPLGQSRAAALAAGSVRDADPDLRNTFESLSDPQTSIVGGTVSVELSGEVAVPFGRVLSWLDPADRDGRVTVTETSHARSPVAGSC